MIKVHVNAYTIPANPVRDYSIAIYVDQYARSYRRDRKMLHGKGMRL